MRINDLRNQQYVKYRLGRASEDGIAWRDWTNAAVFLHVGLGNQVLVLTPGESWAEYRVPSEYNPPDENHPHGYFHREGQYMEIEGITGV